MAKSSSWNSLTPKQQSDFKAKNFNMKVKVTESQLDKLRKEGTPTKAIAKYKSDPSMREALNRFYGKDRVTKVAGSAASKPTKPKATSPSGKTPPPAKKTTTSRVTPKKVTPKSESAITGVDTKGKNDDLARNVITAISLIPAVRGARFAVGVGRGIKGIMAAKKAGTPAAKRAKPSTVGSTVKDVMGAGKKQTGRRAAPKVTSSGKRAKPAATPRRAKPTTVKSTVKDIAGIASRKTGARAKPPAAARRAANAESKSTRSRVTGRVVKTRTTGRRAKGKK